MCNSQFLQEVIEAYHKRNSKSDLLKFVEGRHTDCWLIHYLKADAIYSSDKKDYRKALVEIKKSIKEYENPILKLLDCSRCYESKDNYVLKLYFLAGQLYAENDDEKKSLKCYQKYQYYSKVKSDFSDKESVIVYSFRRYNEYTLSDIINNTITVCHPSMMNDPFDTLIFEWTKCLNDICTEKKHIKPFSESFDFYKIRSFVANSKTMDSDDSIVSKIKMWSHYADDHMGLCLKYRLSKTFFEKPDESKSIIQCLKKITYAYDEVSVNKTAINTKLAYTTKYAEWENENEVRLIYYNPSVNSSFYGIPLDKDSRVEAVYFGIRMDEQERKTIKKIFRRKNVLFYEMNNKDKNKIYNIKPFKIK